MASSLIAQVTGKGGIAATTFTTTPINTTGANFLFASFGYFENSSVVLPTLSDNKGNTWTALPIYGNTGGTVDEPLARYYCANANVGTNHTFTLARTPASFAAISVLAFSEIDPSGALDQDIGAAQGSTLTHQPGSLTPSGNNYILITSCMTDSQDIASISAPFDPVTLGNGVGFDTINWVSGQSVTAGTCYEIQTTAIARNPTWTFAGPAFANVAMAIFKTQAALTPTTNSLATFGGI